MTKSRDIGTRGETAVARWLAANGFPHCERRRLRGSRDEGDLITHPGLVVEVKAGAAAKNAGPKTILDWLAETEAERVNASASVGLLVVQRLNRMTPGPAGWDAVLPLWAVTNLHAGLRLDPAAWVALNFAPVRMSLENAVELLRRAGYGDPIVDAQEGAA